MLSFPPSVSPFISSLLIPQSHHSSARVHPPSVPVQNRQRSCCASFLRYRPLSLPSPLLCSHPNSQCFSPHCPFLSQEDYWGELANKSWDAAKDESGFSLWRPLCFRATRSLAGWPSKIAISERFDLRATRGDRANTALCQVV